MKETLDRLVRDFETQEFIKDDPVFFAHYFKNLKTASKGDIEIASLTASLFAFGRRDVFIQKLKILFEIMENEPLNFILEIDLNKNKLKGFLYRFIKDDDLIEFLCALNRLYKCDKSSLEELFSYAHSKVDNVFSMLQIVCDSFYSKANITDGLRFMLSNPKNNGAMKRMNMFLRWMVRKNSPVDLGLWDFMQPSELLIPLDIHVGKVSRSLGLLHRNSNDFKAVNELTLKLREFDSNDPVKYDFALFAAGVTGLKTSPMLPAG